MGRQAGLVHIRCDKCRELYMFGEKHSCREGNKNVIRRKNAKRNSRNNV